MSRRQGIYWIGTIPRDEWEPCLPEGIAWIKGQPEVGEETGYLHWQVLACTTKKQSLSGIKRLFGGSGHWELTRSQAAEDYVWKEATRDGEQFEFGRRPTKRNSHADWEDVKAKAQSGNIEEIPADIYVRYYRTIQAIAADFASPVGEQREVIVFWGPTGSGKSRRAWEEAGIQAYSKDPRSKFWCGYRGQKNCVIDEFRGGIDVSHILRWFDRYPVNVEIKGSSKPLQVTKYWVTSNIEPRLWYPELDSLTVDALLRRLTVFNIQ